MPRESRSGPGGLVMIPSPPGEVATVERGDEGIVIGVDGRPPASRAVVWAAREADRRGVPLYLVAAGITAADVAPGPPGAVGPAQEGAPCLAVVSSDAASGGTVAADAACPLVVVPERFDLERHVGEVVVALDPAAPEAFRDGLVVEGAEVARGWQRPLLIAVVLPGAHAAPAVGAARRAFDAAEELAGQDVRIHEVLAHGDPAEELAALTGPATGLLVLGMPGHGPPTGDDVGRAVLERVGCPVALVPVRPSASPFAPARSPRWPSRRVRGGAWPG